LFKAMKQEVAELSGNFCRELSSRDGGEGVRYFCFEHSFGKRSKECRSKTKARGE